MINFRTINEETNQSNYNNEKYGKKYDCSQNSNISSCQSHIADCQSNIGAMDYQVKKCIIITEAYNKSYKY